MKNSVANLFISPKDKPNYSIYSSKTDTKLIKFIKKAYIRWAYFIAAHLTLTIVICIAASCICAVKVLKTP